MTQLIEVVPTTEEHIVYVARHINPADRDEIEAFCDLAPEEAIRVSAGGCLAPETATIDGVPLCIFGVNPGTSILAQEAYIWLIGTDQIKKHRARFLRQSCNYVQRMLAIYPHLLNYVDERHKVTIRWLKWLGFTVHPGKPMGVKGLPFCLFEMRR